MTDTYEPFRCALYGSDQGYSTKLELVYTEAGDSVVSAGTVTKEHSDGL